MARRIVVVGSSNTDMVLKMDRIPKPGETILGGEFVTAAGGKGANQAVAAAMSGGEVFFVGRVGRDVFGEKAVTGLAEKNINVDFVKYDESPSGIALIFVGSNAENAIGVASGANLKLSPEDVAEAKPAFAKSKVVVLQLETPLETVQAAAELAAENGAMVILNPAPAQVLSNQLLSLISIITPNESEVELLTGVAVTDEQSCQQAAGKLHEKGVENVIITLGSRGAYVSTRKLACIVSGYKVQQVDTTAAGDTFNGALAVAISEGLELFEAIRFANAAAALSVTRMGAQPSAPTRSEIDDFLQQQTKHDRVISIDAKHAELQGMAGTRVPQTQVSR